MSTYEPGTVAMVTMSSGVSHRSFWDSLNELWVSARSGRLTAGQIADVRPLVVIDPEDWEQVERLARAFVAGWGGCDGGMAGAMHTALNTLTKPPPKPAEPTGLGAVVEDESQVEFIHLGSGLWAYGTTDGPSKGFRYAEFNAVRVLSEGVAL